MKVQNADWCLKDASCVCLYKGVSMLMLNSNLQIVRIGFGCILSLFSLPPLMVLPIITFLELCDMDQYSIQEIGLFFLFIL